MPVSLGQCLPNCGLWSIMFYLRNLLFTKYIKIASYASWNFVLFAFNVSQIDFRVLCEIRNRLFIVFHIDTNCLGLIHWVDCFSFFCLLTCSAACHESGLLVCLLSVWEVECLCCWSSCLPLQYYYLSSLQTVFSFDSLGFFDLTVVQKWYAFIRNCTLNFDLISSVASNTQYDTHVWFWAAAVSQSSQSAMQSRG